MSVVGKLKRGSVLYSASTNNEGVLIMTSKEYEKLLTECDKEFYIQADNWKIKEEEGAQKLNYTGAKSYRDMRYAARALLNEIEGGF